MVDYNDMFSDDDCPPWLTATQHTECNQTQMISCIYLTQEPIGDYACDFIDKNSIEFKSLQVVFLHKDLLIG